MYLLYDPCTSLISFQWDLFTMFVASVPLVLGRTSRRVWLGVIHGSTKYPFDDPFVAALEQCNHSIVSPRYFD